MSQSYVMSSVKEKMNRGTYDCNSIQSAEELALNLDTPLDEDDYEPYHISDFGAPS
jgi:hypothetical protein